MTGKFRELKTVAVIATSESQLLLFFNERIPVEFFHGLATSLLF